MTEHHRSVEHLDEAALIGDILVYVVDQNRKAVETLTLEQLEALTLDALAVEFGGLTDPLGQLADFIASVVSSSASWIFSNVSNVIEGAKQFLKDLITGAKDTLKTTIDAIKGTVDTILNVVNTVKDIVSGIVDSVYEKVKGFVDTVKKTILDKVDGVLNVLDTVKKTIMDKVGEVSSSLSSLITSIKEAIIKKVEGVSSSLSSAIEGISSTINTVKTTLEGVGAAITGFVNAILKFPEWFPQWFEEHISKPIGGFISQLQQAVGGILQGIADAFSGFVEWLKQNVPKFLWQVVEALYGIYEFYQNYQRSLVEGFKAFLENPLEWIKRNVITPLWNNVVKPALDAIGGFAAEVGKAIWRALPQEVKDFIEKAKRFLTKDLPEAVFGFFRNPAEALAELGKKIYEHLPQNIKGVIDWLSDFFGKTLREAEEGIKGVLNWLKDLVTDPVRALQALVETILKALEGTWQAIVDWWGGKATFGFEPGCPLARILQERRRRGLGRRGGAERGTHGAGHHSPGAPAYDIYDATMTNRIQWWEDKGFKAVLVAADRTFVPDLFDFFKFSLLDHINWFFQEAAQKIREVAVSALSAMWAALQAAFEGLYDMFSGAVSWLVQSVKNIGQEALTGIGKTVTGLLNWLFQPIYEEYRESLVQRMNQVLSGPAFAEGEVVEFIHLTLYLLFFESAFRVASSAFHVLGDIFERVELALQPFGLGAKINFRPGIVAKEIAKVLWHIPQSFTRHLLFGIAFWFSNIYTRIIGATLRDTLPVEVLPPATLTEITKRFYSTEAYDWYKEYLQRFLMFYGYPTTLVEAWTAGVDDKIVVWKTFGLEKPADKKEVTAHVEYKDRFGQDRKLPLSLVFSIPTEHDLAAMMVRDIFQSIDDFIRVIKARGVYEDTAFLYYLMRFKYPPPEKLWEFFCRAQAGLLWYRPSKDIMSLIEKEAKKIGAPMPKPPADLNVDEKTDPKKLLDAITQYMKWHDYAWFAWVDGFTSDAFISLDLMADIPQRIDARWMYKWAVFTALEPKRWAKDELGLGTIVIARGYHPHWVPLITAAEVMNALAEERTVFRTGIMRAFREGMTTVDEMKSVLGGAFKLTITVPVWNPAETKFKPKDVQVPVKFLEGERLLLMARALYDRAYDLIHDLTTTLLAYVRENLISPDEFKSKYTEYFNKVKKAVEETAKNLGLQDAVKIALDTSYLSILDEIAKFRNEIDTVNRIRGWIRYSLYALLWRFQRGLIDDDEIEKWANDLANRANLTKDEKDIFIDVAKFLRDIYRREIRSRGILRRYAKGLIDRKTALQRLVELGLDEETAEAMLEAEVAVYIPTVSQIATLAETVPKARELLDEVMEIRGVPPRHREIWREYVKLAPLRNEVRSLITEYISAYAAGVVTQQEFESFLKELAKYGYEPEEIELIRRRAELRRRRTQRG